MANNDGNPGMSKLAKAIDAQMKRYHDDITGDLTIDFGIIGGDWSLQVNSFPQPIPKGDYYVCRSLTMGLKDDILTKTQEIGKAHSGSHQHKTINAACTEGGAVSGTVGEATGPADDPPDPPDRPVNEKGSDTHDGEHQHHVLVPEKMRSLKPGDHVLVAWVQNEVCVIDIIISSKKL